jgi:hypothetical protein
MGRSLKILLIHGMPSTWLGQRTVQRTVYNREFALLRYAPEHRYVLWCPHMAITPAFQRQVKDADAILLGTTLLCARWMRPRAKFEQMIDVYKFIADAPGRVMAFPQDDYFMNETLDDWFEAWNVDTVYTPLLEHQAVLYPKTHKTAQMRHAFTGYADDSDRILASRWAKAWEMRDIDVSYRAKNLPAYYGRLGRQKAEIADKFVLGLLRYGANLKIDIQTGGDSTHFGTTWLKFLGDSKFVLGSPSGSSMLDPRGLIHDAVTQHQNTVKQNLSLEDAEATWFPGQDGKHLMGALGPRNIESALAGCCQILAASDQYGPMKAGEHFIALQPDGSNMGDVLEQMKDTDRVKQIVKNTGDLFEQPEYSYGHFANRIIEDITGEPEMMERKLWGVDALLADYRMQNSIWDSELAPPE